MNTAFAKLQVLEDFLKEIEIQKKKIIEELCVNANDPVIRTRRFRMLSQLANYESDTIKKIANFESDKLSDYFSADYRTEIGKILNRSA